MIIQFITHNLHKLAEAKHILEPEVTVEHTNYEYDEIQHDDPLVITKEAAKRVCEELGKPVVVDDSGLFIDVLGGFPGTYSSPVHKKIGLKGLLKLMDGESNRGCSYQCAVGYCEPGKEPIGFLGKEQLTLATEIKGEHGFGHDPIVIPNGSEQTIGEMADFKDAKRFRRDAFLKLKDYLAKQ